MRAEWVARRIARYRPESILEVGCGYGKLIRAIRGQVDACPIVGVDFSPTQLEMARTYLEGSTASTWRSPRERGCRSPTGRSTWS